MVDDVTAPPVRNSGVSPGRRNLRPPWQPGQSGNPKGRPSQRRIFEEALGSAVIENTPALVKKILEMALQGDARMMAVLLDRLVPRIARHELEATDAPTRITFTWATDAPATDPELVG